MNDNIVELNISDKEKEQFVRSYILDNMLSASFEQYIQTLDETGSLGEACKVAIINEMINIIIKQTIENF